MRGVVTLKETNNGKLTLRLVRASSGYAGLVIDGAKVLKRIDGDDGDEVWRQVHNAAARLNPIFIGFSSARARFLYFFPNGFAGADYVTRERDYKLTAKAQLELAAPLESVAGGANFGEQVFAVFNRTNLLSPFEKIRLRELMLGTDADAFVRLAADFTMLPGHRSLTALNTLLKHHECAKWTVVTYLPFLWRPNEHVFLKPTMLTTFAERVGHPFARIYRPNLDYEVYDALIALAAKTRAEVADLGPRDFIDIQSFMWTVVEYKDEDKSPTNR